MIIETELTLNDYQQAAARTGGDMGDGLYMAIAALGLNGEAGEVADLVKKHLGHGHEMNRDEIAKELGDVLWYLSEVARLNHLSLEEIARRNIEKLQRRYPDGFSHAASRERTV